MNTKRESKIEEIPNPIFLDELCKRLSLKTGLSFSPLASLCGTPKVSKAIPVSVSVPEGIIELGYLSETDTVDAFSMKLLSLLGTEVYEGIKHEAEHNADRKILSWEDLFERALENGWDEATFNKEIQKKALPPLPCGLLILVKLDGWSNDVPTVLKNVVPDYSVFHVHKQDVIIYKPYLNKSKQNISIRLLGELLVRDVHTILADELGIIANVFVGKPRNQRLWQCINDLYKLARIHSSFFPGQPGLASWNAGIWRLLDEIPVEQTKWFIEDIFTESIPSDLLETLEVYFSSSLNISETARNLFIHRNTLMYRFDRITEITGYNPRDFFHAVHLYLAVLLSKGVKI